MFAATLILAGLIVAVMVGLIIGHRSPQVGSFILPVAEHVDPFSDHPIYCKCPNHR